MEVKINGWPISTPFHSIDSVHAVPHKGIDYAINQGTAVPSITDGTVTNITHEGTKSFGNAVWVKTPDGKEVIYGHLESENVHVGQQIHQGDVIGLSGNTGHSTGPHLHIQVMQNGHAIDPTALVNAASEHKDIPWWDMKGHAIEAAQGVEGWIGSELQRLGIVVLHGIGDGLGLILPVLALSGIIWWMCPFLPKADKAPKLIGSSLIIYMFYCLIKGAYA